MRQAFTDGRAGWGEALPRPYVTGETVDSVIDVLRQRLWPHWLDRSEQGIPSSLDALAEVLSPPEVGGRRANAAAGALELSCLPLLDWPQRAGGIDSRVSGVIGSADPARTRRKLRQMLWFGLRDIKLKLGLGDDVDRRNLQIVSSCLGRRLQRGGCTLRVDVNGGWAMDQVRSRVAELPQWGVCAVEQPTFCSAGELVKLAAASPLPLMADESLLTQSDAHTLLTAGDRIWWNLRIGKNGGVGRVLSLARMAAENRVPFVLGCMVGETSLLSAWQRVVLQIGPRPRFVEGNYGRFLLRDDVFRRSLRFGYAGKLRAISGAKASQFAPEPARLARLGRRVDQLRA